MCGQTIADITDKKYDDDFKNELSLIVAICLVVVVFFYSLIKNIGIFRYLGLIVVVMVVYLTVVTIF